MNAPLDPSISDLLRGSSLAPLMDQPVSHILHSMGLPPLPTIPPLPPLPGLPPMPVIDLAAIVKPMTDMAASFGSGQFGGAAQHNSSAPQASNALPAIPGLPAGNNASGSPTAAPSVDPTQVLTAITTGLQIVMQLGTSALQVVMQMWQGQGATQAASTGAEAASSGSQLATQSTGQKAVLGAGAGSVFTGAALMDAVMTKYLATMAASAPALSVPGGGALMVAATADAIAEGLAVITKTRVELMIHSANMVEAGQKVPVTSAPTGVNAGVQAATAADTAATSAASSGSELKQLMQLISPVSQLLSTGVQSATQLGQVATSLIPHMTGATSSSGTQLSADKSAPGASKGANIKDSTSSAHSGGGGGGVSVGGLGGIAAIPATPLTPYTGTQLAGSSVPGSNSTTSEALATEPVSTSSQMSGTSPGVMPMGGAGAAAAAARGVGGAGDAGGGPSGNLVTASNGDEVVGDLEGATLPVVGAHVRAVDPPPDKELTL